MTRPGRNDQRGLPAQDPVLARGLASDDAADDVRVVGSRFGVLGDGSGGARCGLPSAQGVRRVESGVTWVPASP
jgi:hypothetical protein